MKKVAIYARVSTEKQEEQRTIDSQIAELRQVCKKDGAEIVKEYIDNGLSGATLIRPGLDQLRDDASKGLFEAVYILSPDRLARKYLYQALVIEELKKKRIEIIFLNKPLTDTPEDQLLLGIEGLVAEYERAKIFERTRRGRLHRAGIGEIMGGLAPYGYKYVSKAKDKAAYYEINGQEAEIVKLIFSLYLKLKSTGKIVKALSEKKIRPRGGSKYWSKGLIHKILTNECYIGTAHYNKHDKGRGGWRVRDKSEWIAIKIPEIIDGENFKLVQTLLKRNGGGKRIRVYILSGLIRCKCCGSKYIGNSVHSRHFYYRCANFLKVFPEPKRCNSKQIKAENIENTVLSAIKSAILKPQILMDHVLALAENVIRKGIGAENEKKRLMTEKRILKDKKAKLLELYLDGAILKSAYLEKKTALEEAEEKLEKREQEINQNTTFIDKSLIMQNVEHFSELAKEKIEKLSPGELQEFFGYLIDEIIFDSDKMEAKILGHIPQVKVDSTGYNNLFQSSIGLSGEIWNKNLKFELTVQV